ncbi:alpha/beta hydrolase [Burkholderia sp. Ax-1724]|uniref:alpha/beta hydrolase n=1 Tax=Burkholderia sp. Ax-1724 TaxID=2608336 RepID=UPI0014240445|nr:alpha/beta hydrolase [Burkholderia sp. Ax-1724]NIF55116.1 lysophospholipase [Burkholderia sp. Ax-1724]
MEHRKPLPSPPMAVLAAGVRSLLVATLAAASLLCARTASAAELIQIPSRPDVTQGIWLDAPSSTPPWIVILFAGDNGNVGLASSGPMRMAGNFVLRTASYWTGLGDAAVIFDTPSDHPDGMDDPFRLSDPARQDVAAAISVLRQRYPQAKIALVGTSRGTITVGNLLKRSPDIADAFVLTSPVTVARGSQAGLSGLAWPENHARVLVVSNENDGCMVSPFGNARSLASGNGFAFIAVSSSAGGGSKRAECGAHAPHGFLGIEQQVLDDISGWLQH